MALAGEEGKKAGILCNHDRVKDSRVASAVERRTKKERER